jgi:alpha-1,3-rhamnosyl/mannosyltransferase
MDVLVNIHSLRPPITGIGRYTAELLNCLTIKNNIQAFDRMSNYSQQELKLKLKHLDELPAGSNVRNRLKATLLRLASELPYAHILRHYIQQKINKQQFEKCSNAVYWEPNYILQPFDGVSVTTIHDLSFIHYPQHSKKSSVKWLENNIEASIEQASAIITLSEFSKNELMRSFAIPESKITIVSPAVSDKFKQAVTTKNIEYIKKKYGLPDKYILSVGTLEPRKNIKSLLQAYSALPRQLRQDFPLVLVGAKGWGVVNNDIQLMLNRKEILVLGYISQNDIPILYKAADLFVYLSLYEGYGMPVAEAMASGVAVITSENSAMSEVARNNTALVNPLDIGQISEMMQYYLTQKEARDSLIDNYSSIVSQWSWHKSADTLTTLFQTLK